MEHNCSISKTRIMEIFGVREPQWILDETKSGQSFWRRNSDTSKHRVTFRCDVEVKEFETNEYEVEITTPSHSLENSFLAVGITFLVCAIITIVLPWYILMGR